MFNIQILCHRVFIDVSGANKGPHNKATLDMFNVHQGIYIISILILLIQRKLLYDSPVHISLRRGHLGLKISIYPFKVLICSWKRYKPGSLWIIYDQKLEIVDLEIMH